MEGGRDDVRMGGVGPTPTFSRGGNVVLISGVTGKEESRRGTKESDVRV